MTDLDDLAGHFEQERPRLWAVATHLLGSAADAEDAVQETWLRLERSRAQDIHNLQGWLTTVVSRVSLDILRSRRRSTASAWLVEAWPGEANTNADPVDPEPNPADLVAEADRAGAALLLVLEILQPAERIALVLHDVFGYSFEEVAQVLGRSGQATRQLASRARRRVRQVGRPAVASRRDERLIVDAWLAAVRTGDLGALVSLLSEQAVLQADFGEHQEVLEGADAISQQAVLFGRLAERSVPLLIGGLPGLAAVMNGRVVSLMAFQIVDDQIDSIEVLADPQRLGTFEELGLAAAGQEAAE
ncbi:DNA-directed RNA polymerase sigma-70 factor [Kineosporia sp. NBRC 101677]|uniref:sigma-70 family RNA polymerase sigma factor n=1 Tax=Kineosporia sp. NBRC 101677 TaxID=3032197 RepID=UPI0024A4F6EB|nr:sigma-70 family RNA polymerase sigma factor [Kineosporia sp. NBRC 101677]GLY19604.1 DNA-directed RNA polymerase sigma-70 factor [Kineosporia sp. NBRC 101677]